MSKELISVVIPAYNHEKYVQETIKSIINQTYENIELIIIDDGSKDITWQKICEMKDKCEARFSRVHFETQENQGTCVTFNKLFSLAKGDFLYIIASDDLAKPNAIEIEADFLSKNPKYGLVVGDNEIIDSEGIKCYWNEQRNNVYNEKEAVYKTFVGLLNLQKPYFHNDNFGTYKTLYESNYIPNGYLIRKSFLDKVEPFTKEAPLEDWYLMLQLSKYCKFKYIDKILFSYRWHDNNAIKNSEKMSKYTEFTRIYEEKMLKSVTDSPFQNELNKIYKCGVLYKRMGIPYFVEIQFFRKYDVKIRVFKIFNITIFRMKKNNY